MSTNIVNQTPFLRTSRNFPLEAQPLAVETNKSYVDIANAVNSRVIGLYTTRGSIVTGETWALEANQKRQSLRKVFQITSTSPIDHGIDAFSSVSPNTCGSYTNGTNWYGLIFGTSVAVAGLITFYVTSTQILFLVGAGAPTLTGGTVVLEWLSQV